MSKSMNANNTNEVTIQAVDCILYNRRAWREVVELLEPRTSTSLVTLPVARIPGDPVGTVATSRATITFVLDAVDRTIKHLPREHQRIAKLKFEEFRTHKNIANAVGYSEKTIERRVEQVRNAVKNSLESLGYGNIQAFWREIEKMLTEKRLKNV